MNTLPRHRFLRVAVTALATVFFLVASGHGGKADTPSETVSLEPGKHKEVCFKAKAGQGVNYRFTSDRPVAFNIHYHDGPAVHYPVELNSVREAADKFVADADRGYCLMWSNRTKKKTKLTYRVDLP